MSSLRPINSPLPRLGFMGSLSPHAISQEPSYIAETKLGHKGSAYQNGFVSHFRRHGWPASPPPPFRRPYLALVQPEVVRHLVPDRVFHQLGEVLGTARHALVGALENRDAVRHRERFEHAPPGQRTPFIQTQQGPAARHAPARQLPRVGLGLHNHGDILQPLAEAGRNAFARGGDQTVKFGGLHGRFATCSHSSGLLLPQPERLHLRDVLIDDAQFPRPIAGEFQLEVHDLVVALVLVVELQFVAFGLGKKERRFAVFHRLCFDQFALLAEGNAADVHRPRDFLTGFDLQHQEDLSLGGRFPGALKLGRLGQSAQAHQEKQTGGNAGRCAHTSQFSTLPASAFRLHPKRLRERGLCRPGDSVIWVRDRGTQHFGFFGTIMVLRSRGRVAVSPLQGVPLRSIVLLFGLATSYAQTFTPSAPLRTARYGANAIVLKDGSVLVSGGVTKAAGQATATAEIFDPRTQQWRSVGPMKTPRQHHIAALLGDGRVLIAGGQNDSEVTAETEIFDPSTKSFSPSAPMALPRAAHAAVVLADGRILVSGGVTKRLSTALTDGVEVFDPASGKWTTLAPLPRRSAQHTATLLTDGRVLVTGGYDERQSGSSQVFAYDSSADVWGRMTPLIPPRAMHFAPSVPDGRVLIGGAADGDASLEWYYPAGQGRSAAGPKLDLQGGPQAAVALGGDEVLMVGQASTIRFDLRTGAAAWPACPPLRRSWPFSPPASRRSSTIFRPACVYLFRLPTY